jgi:hypothetical protein
MKVFETLTERHNDPRHEAYGVTAFTEIERRFDEARKTIDGDVYLHFLCDGRWFIDPLSGIKVHSAEIRGVCE